ncbi:uncharacterized protein LOC125746336 [Brienomyrus brachyistius]|uniref:uncharacterized protein LOC125746336 n=1 Tax=Brienomyrus brachyistius TaxID=42636 RepID=UPI0020B35101|nr:uncharacterized protein LOC125746336 [Brienomyrus brachyistius]
MGGKTDLAAMLDALGMSAEEKLSVKDVRSLCHSILHVSVGPDEVQRAAQKVTGDNVGLFFHAGKLLDTLLEIERDRVANEDVIIVTKDRDTESKEFRMSEARLHTVLPSLCIGRGGDVEAESAGFRWMAPPRTDPLQDMEEKYAILRRKLLTEMLQEHYGVASWEALLPWQQEERVEEQEALAEEVLCAADELALCELPGAFRRYRSSDQVLLRRCREEVCAEELQWTAALSLRELQCSRQREIGALAFLMGSLDVTGLRLLSLCVRLATMRAEREKHSHTAALAASLSWDKWPEVGLSHCEDLARYWLAEESPWAICGESEKASPCMQQQAVLQHVLSCHEKERWFLVELLHAVTLEELAGEEEPHSSDAENVPEGLAMLRLAVITWLRKTRAVLKTRSWGDSALCLLTHLMELQEAEVRAVLRGLLHTRIALGVGGESREVRLFDLYSTKVKTKRIFQDMKIADRVPH